MPRRGLTRAVLAAVAAATLFTGPSTAMAAGPLVSATWASDVTATSVDLHAAVNPEGLSTTYRFQYLPRGTYLANGESFAGAASTPEAFLGFGSADEPAFAHVGGLAPATRYEYRVVATNADSPAGGSPGEARSFTTEESSPSFGLPDGRGWELVSPLDKNGGAIQDFGGNRGGGALQAAAQGGSITYSSASSFGDAPPGAPPASQYIARRGEGGWTSENISAPTLSGVYGTEPIGVPYRIFSEDLARGLMLNGVHCRGEGSGCPVDAPVLTGSGAPAGFQDYYLRDSASGGFTALLSEANDGLLALSASQFDLAFAGASPDLTHVVLSTCAKLTPEATEVPSGGGGCEPAAANLYEWSGGSLRLVNLIAGEPSGSPFATLAAPAGAVSADGSRVYWYLGSVSEGAGDLYLDEGGSSHHVSEAGAQARLEAATADGSVAYFVKPATGRLFRYEAATRQSVEIDTPGSVEGLLGISADGSSVYFATSTGLYRWHAGTTTTIALGGAAAQPGDYPPATGTARVSVDGEELLFLSRQPLTGYDNIDQTTGEPDSQVFLWRAGAGLACISCNPTEERPQGPSTIPGAVANGKPEAFAPGSLLTDSYKPRILSADGHRLFFDSEDSLLPGDTDNRPDVYEWEAQGEGSCSKPSGCLALISSGRGAEGATFVDASRDGADAFFLTTESLIPADPGSQDLYDARIGGGFPEPPPPLECAGDACQPLPQAPEDPTVGTTIPGPGNPPLPPEKHCRKGMRLVVRHGKVSCVKAKHKKHRRRKHRRRR
jgi:hypothetical protein